jgi:simple sugar transport system permease protein
MSTGTLKSTRVWEAVLPALVALGLAAVLGDLLILSFGESPAAVWSLLVKGTWGNAYGVGQVLYKATTLTCTGLAFAMAGRAGLFNVGAEGQLAAGGFGAAVMGLLLPSSLPALLAVPVCLLAAMFVGGAVGALPGALRARFGASEVIVTIMLNFIVKRCAPPTSPRATWPAWPTCSRCSAAVP